MIEQFDASAAHNVLYVGGRFTRCVDKRLFNRVACQQHKQLCRIVSYDRDLMWESNWSECEVACVRCCNLSAMRI